jgi:epsin
LKALLRYECVEPNGKDVGLSVRKKSEAILSILDDREKLQQVREKAATTRDKYIGLSSTGMSYKSSSTSSNIGNYESSNKYGGTNRSKETNLFISDKETKSYNNIERDQYKEKFSQKPRGSTSKDEFDEDFNPRAATTTSGSADKSSKRVDLFVPNLMDDTIDTPASTPNLETTRNYVQEQADLFADATFQSATSNSETTTVEDLKGNIDLFAKIPSKEKLNSSISGNKIDSSFDPFVAIPFNNSGTRNNISDQTDETEYKFGAFTSSTESNETPKTKDGTFQVKSGIWADSLSRGLIELDITAPKKKDSTLSQSHFSISK